MMLSAMFSDTDSTVAAVACSAVSCVGSRLTSDDICARTPAMSPAVNSSRTRAAVWWSILTEKVVLSRNPPTRT